VVLGDKVNGTLIAIGLRYGMMRHLAVCAALFCAFQLSAHAGAFLPSQEEQDLVTIKTCRDHEVLSSLKSAIDSSLQASSVLARGMHAGDVHLEAFGSTGLPSFAPLQLLPRESANGSSTRWPWRDRLTSSNSAANLGEANYFRTNLRSGHQYGCAARVLWTDCDPSPALL
jgi:hypothetical protein